MKQKLANKPIPSDPDYIKLLERYIHANQIRVARAGLTQIEVEYVLGNKDHIKQFNKWMIGQTCGFHERLGSLTYSHDLYRFIGTLRGKPTYWD